MPVQKLWATGGVQTFTRARLAQERVLSSVWSVAVQRRSESLVSHLSQTAGSYGFIYPGFASGTSENESVHEMGFVSTFHPLRDLCHSVTVTCACTEALGHWRSADFYAQGTPLGTVMLQKVVTTDASLTGWGATQEGITVNGLWPRRLCSAHINYLELMTIWKALNYFLPRLQGHHVLVRCNNCPI